jgi:hypothetical protein
VEQAIQHYLQLRDSADKIAEELGVVHVERLACRKGCCQCCTNLSVFPVEFFAMVEEMKKAGWTKLHFDAAAICGYLDEKGECEIYPFRPIICRTQGLPLAFYDDDAQGYSVTFCPKNFVGDEPEQIGFGPDSTLNLDDLNDDLFDIHLHYLAEHPELGFTPQTRIELRRLGEFL